jgi:hypothetical protein
VHSGALTYEVDFDDPVPNGQQIRAVISGQAIDELTGIAPDGALAVSVAEPELRVNINADGSFAVVARPWFRFPPLAAPSHAVHLTVTATGYLPYDIEIHVPTGQRHFASAAAPGDTVLALDDASGIAIGLMLLLGPAASQEAACVAFAGPGANQVSLRSPVQFNHAVGDPLVPDLCATTALGQVPLRRPAVVVKGRAFARDDSTNSVTPVAAATIVVKDFWRTVASTASANGTMTTPVVADRAFALATTPGAHAAHAIGAPVAAVSVTPLAADDKLLVDAASAGATLLHVSNRIGLAVGDLLVVDADAGTAAEPVTVAAVQGWGAASTEGHVTLAEALTTWHRAGARIERLAAPSAGAGQVLEDAVAPGDSTVFVDAVGALAATGWIALGAGTPEYQGACAIQAVSDADGYFQLPALHRIATLALEATAPARSPVSLSFAPDYSVGSNVIQIVFS